MARSVAASLVIVCLLVAPTLPAAAQAVPNEGTDTTNDNTNDNTGGLGGLGGFAQPAGETGSTSSPPSFGAGARVEIAAPVPFDPDAEPVRAHESFAASEPVCADAIRYVFSFIFGLGGSFPEVWCSPIACGAERVDELVPSASDPSVWAEYIYGGTSGLAGQVVATVNAVGASLYQLATGLANGERPDPEAIRVFNYCRHIDSGLFEEADTRFDPYLSWSATVDTEYPRAATLASLVDQAWAEVELSSARPQTSPPIESGNTIVKLPTWFWVEGATEQIEATATSSEGLAQASVRATFTHVEFALSNGETLTCGPEDVAIYDPETDDPFDDEPACSVRFTETGDLSIDTTLFYEVEQRVRLRDIRAQPWVDSEWVPHPASPFAFELSTTDFAVHELFSLNVNREIVFDEG